MKITPEMTVKETILRYPKAMEVFDVHRLVMCCNAEVSIARVAERYGKDREVLLRMLNQVAAG